MDTGGAAVMPMPVIEVPVRPQTRRRVRNHLPLVIALWVLSVLGTGWVASATEVGPVVYELTTRRGLHLADVLLASSVAVTASLASWLLLRPPPPAPPVDGEPEVELVALELRRLPWILLMWVSVLFASLWAAFETEVGPVLFVYNNHRSARLGDLVFTLVLLTGASFATAALLSPRDDAVRGARRPRR
jgi:hypothetical protein